MRAYAILTIALLLALVSGCGPKTGQATAPDVAQANANAALRSAPPVQQYPPPAPRTEGSLFSDSAPHPNLFTDMRARQVGDIITINIVETAKAKKKANTTLDRSTETTAGMKALLGYESSIGLGESFTPSNALDLSYDSGFTGKGETSREDTVTAQISARVIQVLPNGNMVIRGSRETTVNYEKQYIVLQGIVRPQDVSPQNTVLSSYIADARISYKGDGDLSRSQRKGWGSRLIDAVWPF